MIRRSERAYRWLAGLLGRRAAFDSVHRHPEIGQRAAAYVERQRGTRRAAVERIDSAQAALQAQRRQTLRTAELLDMAVELLPAAARADRTRFAEIYRKHRDA